ncbi:MAG: DASS family sodium-coupled anion symporter [Halieaceae bacterium]|jgi:sodium-dependent dicarboxylate transporter 2/3/5|nr:DASS family sodium-coupled anion symporter [Halieaceae bacterium]
MGNTQAASAERGPFQRIGLFAGPAICALMLVFAAQQSVMPEAAWRVAAVALWMAVWWATEAIPVPATAFIPIASFDLLGVASTGDTVQSYAHPTIYLFLGAFVVALAVEKWTLHRRLALWILSRTGTDGKRLILGFMLVAALLSMWITNTSTTMMLLPIAISVGRLISDQGLHINAEDSRRFQIALMLSLAYAATIGGLSTLVGTPPNILLAAFLQETYGREIAFLDWMMIGVPLAALMLPLGWWVLTSVAFRFNIPATRETQAMLGELRAELGPMSIPEKRVALVFLVVVTLWITRGMLTSLPGLSGLNDTGIVMAAALLMFVIPSGAEEDRGPLMSWLDLRDLPWGVLILFGGGLALAAQVSDSGLAQWLGESLSPLASLGVIAIVLASAGLVVFLTELTSNLATAATFLPVIAAIALTADLDPLVLCVPVTLAASCAFMLPVATPPNAIVFSSGVLRIADMLRAGFLMNLVALVLLTIVAVLLVPAVLG